MNSNNKKILLVIDTACYSPVSMQSMIELAAGLQAGIEALYVEDINLLTAVDLPFTREVSIHTASISNINSAMMTEKLRADAENIKRQIEKIAISHRVSISFSSIRGQKTQLIKNRTQELSMALIPAVYSTADRAAHPQTKQVLAVVYDEQNPSSEKALSLALSQAIKNSYELFVIVDSQQSKQYVEQQTSQYSDHVVCHVADFSGTDELLSLLQQHSPKLLVATEHCRLISNEQVFQRLINSLGTDILLVR